MTLDSRSSTLRMSILASVAFALFAALFARVWFLQIMNEEQFVAQATGNIEREVVELAPRGRILDIKGRILVDNRPSIIITIDKETIVKEVSDEDLGDLFLRLAREISRTGQLTKVSDIEDAFESNQFGPFAEVPVVRDVTPELQLYLAEHSFQFPGVNTTVVTVREYPYGELAAHMLGFVGALNVEEQLAVEGKPKKYQPNDEIGKSGLELFYEDQLRGTPGFKTIEVDKFSNVLRVLSEVKPKAGSDIRLTIDIDLQALVEAELKRGLDFARGQDPWTNDDDELVPFDPPAGAVVILDPRNGRILAMASFPTYDPREFVNGISEEAFAELTDPENDLPLLNRTIQGEYAPGSTFKPFTTYAALDTGLIGSRGLLEARSIYLDRGTYRIPGCPTADCVFTNAGSDPLGEVDLRLALTLSSDVYFYNLAANFDRLQFDRDSVQQAAIKFGFGSATGVTLPAESIGHIPTPRNRVARSEANPQAFPPEFSAWTTGDTLNTSIGQGDVLATPLQIVTAYAVIANGGTLYAPNLGDAVLDPITAEAEIEFEPRVIRELYYPPLIADPIYEGLAGVTVYEVGEGVNRLAGTAQKAFAEAQFPFELWQVGGKTGTSEKQTVPQTADFAVFVGYGPLPNARYVAIALLEEAGFGGNVAAPVIARIFKRIAEGTVPEVLTEAEQSSRDATEAAAFALGCVSAGTQTQEVVDEDSTDSDSPAEGTVEEGTVEEGTVEAGTVEQTAAEREAAQQRCVDAVLAGADPLATEEDS